VKHIIDASSRGFRMTIKSANDDSFIFRKIDLKDILDVMALYETSIVPIWREHGRDFDLERVRENIMENLDDENYFFYLLVRGCGTSSRDTVGYLAWEKHRDHTSNHIIAHLRMILVHPDRRRHGLASLMMEKFEDDAGKNGCTKILFDVLSDSPANEFYGELGYRQWSNYMEKYL